VRDRIAFHLDENMDPKVAAALTRHGVDVTTTVGAGLRTSGDDEQLEYVMRDGRVLVTDDEDFLVIAASDVDHSGIVYVDRHRFSIGQKIRGLILIYEVLAPAEIAGRVEYVFG